LISYRAVPELRRSSWAPEELASSVWRWWENKNLITIPLNRFRNIDLVLGKFHIFSRFRSKPFLDPQNSISSRFWRAWALSPPQTLYSSVIEGQGQSETDKTRLTWVNQVRRPRSNISLRYHAEDPRHENWVKNDYRRLDNGYFWSNCVFKVPNAGIEPPNTSKLQKMSDWDQSDDLELLQNNYHGASRNLRFQSKPDLDPQSSIFNRFRRTGALFPSQTLYPTVIEAHGQSEIDKNRLSRPSRIRRPARTHLWVITRRTL